jgi:hypothetical protein
LFLQIVHLIWGFRCDKLFLIKKRRKLPMNILSLLLGIAAIVFAVHNLQVRGCLICSTLSGLCCSACENDDGTFTVVVVNSNVFDQLFVLNFEKELDGLKFDRYIFEASKNYRSKKMNVIAPDKKILNVKKSIKDTIPGGSVAVYTTKRKQEQ